MFIFDSTADQLASLGYRVLVGCRKNTDGHSAVAEICLAHGDGSAVAAPLDLATAAGVDDFAQWARA